ncbi:MAG: methyltransferase dimerization domain-containing protein [Acidimicrobiia bacterium]
MVESDFELIEMVTGYQPAAAVTAGLETGLFDALNGGPATSGQLAIALGVDDGALHALLEALVALGMAEKEDDEYRNTSYVSERVAGGGPMASVIRKEALFSAAWQELTQVVKPGSL